MSKLHHSRYQLRYNQISVFHSLSLEVMQDLNNLCLHLDQLLTGLSSTHSAAHRQIGHLLSPSKNLVAYCYIFSLDLQK